MSRARSTLLAAGLFAGSLAILALVLSFAGATVKPESFKAPPQVGGSVCGPLAQAYRSEVAQIRSCERDDECAATTRGRFYHALDGCIRALRADASPKAADAAADRWMAAGCAHEMSECPEEPPGAICQRGVCVERPPPGVPRDWQRTDVAAFALFLPPDLERQHVTGTDSIVFAWKREGMTLSLDYGQYSDPLANDDEPSFVGRVVKHVTLAGLPAKLVRARVDLPAAHTQHYMSGVHLPDVPCRRPGCWDEHAKLTVYATCPTEAACDDAERIFRTLWVY